MNFSRINPEIISSLKRIAGENFVFADEESLEKYSHDETEDLSFPPEAVVKPANTKEISEILKLCNEKNIPVTPRGAGTGLSGGALPVHGGIVLSTERLNRIIEIDDRNFQATVEPGVITQVFQEAVKEKGLFYPPDPASKGSCFLGGNLAESAGGPKAVKYGLTKDYVLAIEVVLPTGEIINTGARVLKNSTGYNLTQLIIGSEGTLGVITKIIFKLIPYPQFSLTMLVPFYVLEDACKCVSDIFMARITPSGLEFLEKDAIDFAQKFLNLVIYTNPDIQAHLLIEVDGNDKEMLYKETEKIYEVCAQYKTDDRQLTVADSAQQQNDLWRLRRAASEGVKSVAVYKEEDTVVPRAELPELLKGVKEIGKKYGFRSVCYGHAGDGNVHVNILKDNLTDEEWGHLTAAAIPEIFKLTVSLGGTISGEHGIGYVQKKYLSLAIDEKQLQLMREIKSVFDPKGILNPGKIFS